MTPAGDFPAGWVYNDLTGWHLPEPPMPPGPIIIQQIDKEQLDRIEGYLERIAEAVERLVYYADGNALGFK